MKKIKIEIGMIYNNNPYNLVKKLEGLQVYINESKYSCLIVNDKLEVLFELKITHSLNFDNIHLWYK